MKDERRMQSYECKVIDNVTVASGTLKLTIQSHTSFFDTFRPGQFALVEIPNAPQLILRRPLSVFGAERETGHVSFVYGIRGKGTELLARVCAGSKLNTIMPLGHGFRLDGRERHVWLVGDGLGCAALGAVAQVYNGIDFEGFFGFKSERYVFANCALPKGLYSLEICTEDGSAGHGGLVTDVIAKRIQTEHPDAILACGSGPFYRRLWEVCGTAVPIQISVEERMGCGIGGCETCVCSIHGVYRRTCTDGPVFNLREVDEYVS